MLRVLQEREFDRVGGKAPVTVNVRVIAATNRDLLKAVAEVTFRQDLYFRLNVFPLTLPPLRDRPEDIPLLVRFLTEKFAARIGKQFDSVSEASLRRLQAYRWPGNIRELKSVIERPIILADSAVVEIAAELLPGASAPANAGEASADLSLETIERRHILVVLQQTDWVIDGPNGAGKLLNLHPTRCAAA